jgi:hypothetical protein
VLTTTDDRSPAAGQNEQPLIRPAMTIVRTAFAVTWRNNHRRGLPALITQRDRESFSEA